MKQAKSIIIPTELAGDVTLKIYGSLRQELIICVPGFQATAEHPTIITVAEYLSDKGFGVITFTFPQGITANIRKQVAVISAIVAYCTKKYPHARVTLVGGSLGALTSAISAAKNKTIHRLITLNGYFGSFFLRGEAMRVYVLLKIQGLWSKEIRDDLWRYIRDNFRPNEIAVPTLVIHATYDRVAYPIQSKLVFQKLSGKKQLLLYPSVTADHELRNKRDIEHVAGEVVKFLLTDYHTRRG